MYMGAGFVSDQVVVPASIANSVDDSNNLDVEKLINLPFGEKFVSEMRQFRNVASLSSLLISYTARSPLPPSQTSGASRPSSSSCI